MSLVYYFSLLTRIQLYGYNIICLSIHLLLEIWVLSSFGAIMNKVALGS